MPTNNNTHKKRGRPPKQKEPEKFDSVEKAVVKKKRNRPDLKNFGFENVKPGDNSRYLRYALVSLDLPPIDISDEKQVEQRINDYFTFCVDNDRKPNMKGLGNWLGVDASTVNSWKIGEYRSATHSKLIKKAVDIMEELWQDYMLNGKVNPTSGIFLGKNCFGYKDVQDIVVTPNNPLGEEQSPEDIQKRIEQSIVIEAEGEEVD